MAPRPKKPPPPPNHGCPTPSPQTPPPHKSLVKPNPANISHSHPILSLQEHHRHVLQLAMIVMACMVGVIMLLCTVSVLIRYFYSRRYSRNRNRRDAPILFDLNGDPPSSDNDDDVEEEPLAVVHPIWYIRTVGLQQSLIDSITVFKYKKDEGIIDGTECSVCLGEFEHDESLRLLPKCSHAFHIPCIDTWLASHKNCPLCRAPVVREGGTEIRAVDQNNQTDSNVSDHLSLQNLAAGHERVEDDDGDGVSSSAVEVEEEEETQPLRRSVSMDSSSASIVFRDVVVDLDTHFSEKVNSSGKDMSIAKHDGSSGSSTSTTINKLASIGRALQKKPVSMRRSFSHNTKFLFPRHIRSQSSTLPL